MSDRWPSADRPTPDAVERRRIVVEATLEGRTSVVAGHVDDHDDRVSASAILGLHKLGALAPVMARAAAVDISPRVRRTLASIAAERNDVDMAALLADPDATVCETACWAAGERAHEASSLVEQLSGLATGHDDPLCREAAVAALGAIGARAGLPAILAATADRATVRRRAVIALAPFGGPEVTKALEAALDDRDWQVRQAAEDLLAISDETESS